MPVAIVFSLLFVVLSFVAVVRDFFMRDLTLVRCACFESWPKSTTNDKTRASLQYRCTFTISPLQLKETGVRIVLYSFRRPGQKKRPVDGVGWRAATCLVGGFCSTHDRVAPETTEKSSVSRHSQ